MQSEHGLGQIIRKGGFLHPPCRSAFSVDVCSEERMQQKIIYSEAEMMADLAATFPGIFIRPLSEYGSAWAAQAGVWTGGDEVLLDDTPIFSGIPCPDPDIYDGRVSHAFSAWLDRRGWYCEWWDGMTFHLRPDTGEW